MQAVKQREEAVLWCPPSSLAAQSLPLGTTASFCPAAGDGEEQQGRVIPVLGHRGLGARDKKKTVTPEEGEGDAELAYADFQGWTWLFIGSFLVPLASSVLVSATGAGLGLSIASG